MFDHFKSGHEIEGGRRKRYCIRRALQKSRGLEMMIGVRDRFGRKIDAHSRGGYAREIRGSVAGPATQVEDAPTLRKTSRQCVASDMFCPQIVIDLAGNDALSREFAHGVTVPLPTTLPIFVFTLMRQSK